MKITHRVLPAFLIFLVILFAPLTLAYASSPTPGSAGPQNSSGSILPGAFILIKSVHFGKVNVGGTFNLTVTLVNIGSKPARFIKVCLSSPLEIQTGEMTSGSPLLTIKIPRIKIMQPFATYMDSPVKYIGEMGPGEEKNLTFRMIASSDIRPNVYSLTISVEYTNEKGAVKFNSFRVGVPVSNSMRPEVIVSAFEPSPNPVPPGSSFKVFLAVKNAGNSIARHVSVEVMPCKPKESGGYTLFPTETSGHKNSPIYPAGREGVLYFDGIRPNETVNGTVELMAKNVEPGVYPVYVLITYDDKNGVRYSREVTVSVNVNALPHLRAYIGNVWVDNGHYYFELDVANDGNVPARGVTVSVSSRGLRVSPPGQKYLGTVESMDYDSADYEVLNGKLEAGSYNLTVTMRYLGLNGSIMSLRQRVALTLPFGLRGGRHILYYVIAGLVAAMILVIYIWRRFGGA